MIRKIEREAEIERERERESGIFRVFSGCAEPPPPGMIFLIIRWVTPLLKPTFTSHFNLRLLETPEANSVYATRVRERDRERERER